jgi:hypothetical protein
MSEDQSESSGLTSKADEVWSRFEDGWANGSRPTIEECLAEVGEADRPAMFVRLLKCELVRRTERREAPATDDYLKRFPEFANAIELAFQRSPVWPDRAKGR